MNDSEMIMQDGKKRKKPTTAEQIIQRLYDGKVPREWIEYVQGWLASGDSEKEVEESLGTLFENKVFFERKSRRELIDALPELRRKAGYLPGRPQRIAGPKVRLHQRVMFRIAAVLIPLLLIGAAAVWIYRFNDGADHPDMQYPVSVAIADRMQVITLPDGSTVELAAGGEMAYTESFPEERAVRLNGEGYFRVARMDNNPFTVTGENIRVTVRGTEFLMNAKDNEDTAQVTLATGSVEVTAGEHTCTLVPGQMLTYDKVHRTIGLDEAGRGELLRLRGMTMHFNDETLDEIFRTVEGYYGVTMEIRPGVDTGRRVIVGFDGTETLDDVLFVLQSITVNGFRYSIENHMVTITP